MPVSDSLDFIGREPGWMVRSGITVILGMLTILFVLSLYISFPETVHARLHLQSASPPAELHSQVTGVIEKIYVKAGESVKKNQLLMQIQSDGDSSQINELVAMMDDGNHVPKNLEKLGVLQETYNLYQSELETLNALEDTQTFQNRLQIMQQRIQLENKTIDSLNSKILNLEEQIRLEKTDFERNKALHQRALVSDTTLMSAQKKLLQLKSQWDDIQLKLRNSESNINETQSQILLLKSSRHDELLLQKNRVALAFNSLKNDVSEWRRKYHVVSPIDGILSLTLPVNMFQRVEKEQLIFKIAEPANLIEGYLILDHKGAGKVSVGDPVTIEIDKFPSHEFGMVEGKVKTVESIPSERGYLAFVQFEEHLQTTFGLKLPLDSGMVGNARIVTNKLSLFERVANKLLAIRDKHVL